MALSTQSVGRFTANAGDDVPAWSAAYTYNLLNQVDTAAVTKPGYSVNWTYHYDSADQLKSASTADHSFNYQYDSAGNRIDAALGDANDLNQYASDTYDARGNLTADATSTYTYNALNKLTAVTPKTLVDGSQRVYMGYDDQGRRIWKQADTWHAGTSTWTSQKTAFAYDGSNLIAEFNVTTQGGVETDTLAKSYSWGINGLQSVSIYNPDGTIARTLLPVADASGNIVMLLNTAYGSMRAGEGHQWGSWGAWCPFGRVWPLPRKFTIS